MEQVWGDGKMSEIQLLSQMEAVRKNPWMYVGSVGEDGAYHLLNELIQNSLDEAVQGFGRVVKVRVIGNTLEVSDAGRGIPTEIHPTENISSLELALTRLHAGSKFQRKSSIFTTGLHGVGLSCVNALSKHLEVVVHRNGKKYKQEFAQGIPLGPMMDLGQTTLSGTEIRFEPDLTIFKGFQGYDVFRIKDLFQELSHLNPGVEFLLFCGEKKYPEVYFSSRGLIGLWHEKISESLFEHPVSFSFQSENFQAEAFFSWGLHQKERIISFVNGVNTPLHGTHVIGLQRGVFRGFSDWARDTKSFVDRLDSIQFGDIFDGWLALLHVRMQFPNFEGQTKSRLTNSEVVSILEEEVADSFYQYLKTYPQNANALVQRMMETKFSRIAAKRAAERVYLQNVKREIDEEVYKEQFGERSKTWHKSAVWITHQELLKRHGDFCKVSKEAIALDVCCGSGVVGEAFRPHVKKVIGLDLTPQMVQLAKTRLDEVVQGNVYQIPFPEESFDLVCTREVLHLLPYPERPVSEIFRVLKPGGQFVVGQILPFGPEDAAWMYRVFKKKQPLIYNMFQEDDFRSLLLGAGFVDLEMKEINVWESIDVWINSYETTDRNRFEIRDLFKNAPQEVREVHPFKILPNGEIQDLWRWCIFSVRKPK